MSGPRRRDAPAGTQVVLRAIHMLKAFTAEHPEWQAPDLATALDLSKTTTHRLLGALESEGLLMRHPSSGGFRLGPASIALGATALRSSELRAAVRPHLRELAQSTGETATLEMLVDDEVLILDEASGPHRVAATTAAGTRWPLHATSTGKALLAAMSEAERRLYVEKGLHRFTAATVTDPAALERDLAGVRERGWAVALEELETGYVAVGAAFPGAMLATALSIGGPATRLSGRLDELGELVWRTSLRLSKELGIVAQFAPD